MRGAQQMGIPRDAFNPATYPATTGEYEYLYIDPVALMMINGMNVTTTTTIELLVNYDITTPARYTQKFTKSRILVVMSTVLWVKLGSKGSSRVPCGKKRILVVNHYLNNWQPQAIPINSVR